MSEPVLGTPHKLVSPLARIDQTKQIDRRPLCILTLDGGIPGTTESSQLVIFKQIFHDLQTRLEEEADAAVLAQIRPCDVFDYIAGSGMGGVFAILFESFEYTAEETLDFYCKLHEKVFLSPHWKSKNKDEARKLLEDTLLNLLPNETLDSALVKRNKNPKCRALTCASNPDNIAYPRLFLDSDHLEPYQLGQPAEDFSGAGHRFGNPAAEVLREIHAMEGNDRILSCIVSIGAGHPGSLKDEHLDAIVRDCEREASELGSRFTGTEHIFFRLNVQQGLRVPLERLGQIATQAHQYLSRMEVGTLRNDLANQLYERPGVLSVSMLVAFVQDVSHSEKKEMHQDIKHIRNTQDTSILGQLEVSKDARHDSAAAYKVQRRGCTVDTRISILQQIESWARSVQYPLESSLFWIYGLAGTGKTTIMQTICEILDAAGLLASSYFCSTQLDSKESKRVFPTIARHLSRHNSTFAQHLSAKLRDDPECAHAMLPVQFRELLCNPWQAARPNGIEISQCVVAIDALDECDSNHGDEVLRLILDAIKNDQLQGLKFLVTSRPVPTIVERAFEMKLGPQIALHEVSKIEVYSDVGRFLNEQLAGKLDQAHIHELTNRADGLFIFASTLVKHLLPPEFLSQSERAKRFEKILSPIRQGKKFGLDDLYKQVFNGALSPEGPQKDDFECRWRILQAVACTAEPTSAQVIARLLDGITVDDVMAVVKSLHSVLFVASYEDPIYVVHASFHEFVTSQTDFPFKCNLSAIHATLTQSCLSYTYDHLRFNLCNIESSFVPDEELDPPIRAIGPLLAYACRHWWSHYKQSNPEMQRAMLGSVHRLIKEKGLFWIEAMSLLGYVRDCRDIFTEFVSMSKVSLSICLIASANTSSFQGLYFFQRSNTVQALAIEAVAMISIFISMTPKTTSQLYLSFLPLWEGKIFSSWRASFQHLSQVISRRTDGAGSCQLIINTAALVISVVFSSDSQHIISATTDNVVQIWDAESGQQHALLGGHGDCIRSVLSVAFSPDSKRLVSGSEDKSVRIWDATSGKQPYQLDGHADYVRSVTFSPDGKRVVSGSDDKSVRIWDANSGKQLCQLDGHADWVRSVAFSHDGKRLVSGSDDKSVRIWDANSGKQLHQLKGHADWVRSIAFSPDGKRVVSGSDDKTVRIWDANSGKQLCQLDGHANSVLSVAFSPNGKRVVSGSSDKSVRIWDTNSGKQLSRLDGHGNSVRFVAFSPDGKRVVSGSDDKTVRIWDANSGTQLSWLDSHANSVRSIVFSPDGKRLVSGSEDKSVRIWDANSGKQLRQLDGHDDYVLSVAFSPEGKRLVSGSDDTSVRIWDANSGKQLRQLDGHADNVLSVAFSPDGKRLASGSADRSVRIWDAKSGKQLHQLKGHADWVRSIAFSLDSKRLASGSDDGIVRIWDANSGKQLRQLNGHGGYVKSVAFSPDGKRLVSGSNDKTVRIWDVNSGKQLRQLDGREDYVRSVAFSPDGKQVVSSAGRMSIQIWDADSGQQLRQFKGHDDSAFSFDFSPDGKRVASGSNDSTIRIWDIESRVTFRQIGDIPESITSVNFLDPDSLPPIRHTKLRHPISRALVLSANTMYIYTREDGWVITSMEDIGVEHRLLWLPPSLRPFHPPVRLAIPRGGFNNIDLSGCTFGEGWSKIYRGGN
ncbi:quinon protein alcohol dehydrogenase-like superfamily [Flagelloscypha sp. PMI_526]|nr:quinon protein alcohol dehydrogenase-like superfamily [Flagelloscypha sp. PMI_526]